jgi:hypothetical protein
MQKKACNPFLNEILAIKKEADETKLNFANTHRVVWIGGPDGREKKQDKDF